MATTASDTVRNASVAAATALMSGGDIQILTASSAVITTHTLGNPAFAAPVSGVAAANAIGSDTSVAGTAATYRIRSSAGATLVTGDVIAVPAGDPVPTNALGIPSLTIPEGATVNVPSFSYAQIATV